jgi:8-oxo-dGTP pyrophosphatase MutT (NUDIX family)
MQMYKVFFKGSCFLLTDNRSLLKNNSCIHIYTGKQELDGVVSSLLAEEHCFHAVIYAEDVALLWKEFCTLFKYAETAGGAVLQDGKILIIRKKGTYDLPKGHLEEGETPEQAAVREVEEECGIKGLKITQTFSPTLHIYFQDETRYLKKTYWYGMECSSGQLLTPQAEEGIEEVFWLEMEQLDSIYPNTYESLKELLEEVRQAHP